MEVSLPRYFRLLFDKGFEFSGLREVLENKLVLNRKRFKAGEDEEDSFFCAEIDDDDLTWDVNETEW